MVRLQLVKKLDNSVIFGKSQFHYGSITTISYPGDFDLYLLESQFHYGSITTLSSSPIFEAGKVMSQFHYGSITTEQTFL